MNTQKNGRPGAVFFLVVVAAAAGFTLVFGGPAGAWLGRTWVNLRALLLAIPQTGWWALVVTLGLAAALASLARDYVPPVFRRKRKTPLRGPVETLAWEMGQGVRKRFFRWLVANRLAEVARSILSEQQGGRAAARKALPHRRLEGNHWAPPAKVQKYLEAGLRNFREAPKPSAFRMSPEEDPFAVDLGEVIGYLEKTSQKD